MLKIETAVIGDKGIAENFKDFGDSLRARLRRAMAGLGSDIAATASGLASRLTGELAGSVKAKQTETDRGITETVGPTGSRNKFVGRLMESGVTNHGTDGNIARGGSKVQKLRNVRKLRAFGQWRVRPRPFMGPAMNAHRSRINSTLEAALADSVAEANR